MTKITPSITSGINTAVFEDIKQMDKAMDVVARTGVKVQELAHRVAISILVHSYRNQDMQFVRRNVTKLYESLPEMVRRNALLDWMNKFGNFTVTMDNKALVVVMQKDAKPDLAKADAMKFWKLTPEKPYEFVDPIKLIEGAIKKLERDSAEAQKAGKSGVDHTALLAALRAAKVSAMIPAKETTSETTEAAPEPTVKELDPVAAKGLKLRDAALARAAQQAAFN